MKIKTVKRIIITVLATCLLLTGCKKTFDSVYEKGLKYLTEGNYEKAIVSFTEAIKIDPKQYRAYSSRARAYIMADKRSEAIRDLEDAIDIGMKAEEIPEEIVGEVISDIINNSNTDLKDLIEFLKDAGFFDGDTLDEMSEKLADIIMDLIREYADGGKSLEELIRYLKELGLIDGRNVANLIDDTKAGEIIEAVIEHDKKKKSITDLVDYFEPAVDVTELESFRIMTFEQIISRFPGFYDNAKPLDDEASQMAGIRLRSDSGAIIEISYNREYPKFRFFTLIYKKALITIEYGYGRWCGRYDAMSDNEYAVKRFIDADGFHRDIMDICLFENNKVADVIEYDGWKEMAKGFYSEYMEAVEQWDKMLAEYGLSVSALYNHKSLSYHYYLCR